MAKQKVIKKDEEEDFCECDKRCPGCGKLKRKEEFF